MELGKKSLDYIVILRGNLHLFFTLWQEGRLREGAGHSFSRCKSGQIGSLEVNRAAILSYSIQYTVIIHVGVRLQVEQALCGGVLRSCHRPFGAFELCKQLVAVPRSQEAHNI